MPSMTSQPLFVTPLLVRHGSHRNWFGSSSSALFASEGGQALNGGTVCAKNPQRKKFAHSIGRHGLKTYTPGWTCQLGSPSTQIGRPKTSIKKDVGRAVQQSQEPQADAERGSAKARPRRKTQADEIPMYKVILLGDEEYVEAHVVTQLQKTVQIDKSEATRIFQEAQKTGSSIVCVVCEEHAEFYAQQLRRQEIFVVVEKDE